ncbi:L-glutamate gamma-semialdehyde dehydrogenase [Saprospira grandis]|uniref:L-glutamate gamma-semialdehyde dehydrogenase n=1 Tax=Saprospira grandis (strain Lewin) TaxID=984262 RepID=H6L085_SAPGL|nr:L-glutamate gamma-semialdehyde dehydrogenase [Saprospira grandis]AFC26249.1 delta-1-pyrroline-5-carboxylate dehydrogenase [Saprospira grandis str. Lewin]WBM74102.1 L-glutamate gamma-semialdehyde dehydrogenase [Saprospira grandis]
MANAFFKIPTPKNEPVKAYRKGSPERASLKAELARLKGQELEIPMIIGGKEVRTGNLVSIHPPHELKHTLGHYHKGGAKEVNMAIDAALAARSSWENTPWQERAAVFLRAAELLAGPYRDRMNAATMLAQSKNVFQAEIDAACEMVDFFRFNAAYLEQVYSDQPNSAAGIWNRLEHRPLEGFVFAVTPFNFTSICANLCAAPAQMGNVVVWKPSDTQIYSAKVIMDLFMEAGLPAGVVNMVFADGPVAGEVCFKHPELSGLHFTGSTKTFQYMWKTIGENIHNYRSYPRIVGETGGKDYVLAYKDAKADQVATALLRGAFEYQGQKCSAASRAYIPQSLWPAVEEKLVADLKTVKMGTVEDFSNFVNAVIDERAYDKITAYIEQAKKDEGAEIIAGGNHSKEEGYFIEPTVIVVKDPHYVTMKEELFGPVMTIFVYEDEELDATIEALDTASPYALTGAIFATDRLVINELIEKLRHTAGNFYVNDKPTGAVVGQQPFGGGRASGTNDKAGSYLNLLRWVSPRTIKETFVSPTDYRYPFLEE